MTASQATTSPASLLTWHLRLSYLGEASIRRLHKQGVITVTSWDRRGLERCDACRKSRMARRRFGSRTKYRATRPLEIIHSDVCQLSTTSREGYRYFVSFIDDYSKYVTVYHLHWKSQVFESFVHFTSKAERETGLRVVDLRIDNGGEYISKLMKDWCRHRGINQTMGPPHTPQLHGVLEIFNRTLLDRLKPSLKHSSLDKTYWSDALDYAVWKTNRSPTRTNDGFRTPCEVYEGQLPSMRHAHIFGARGQYLIPSANRQKLDDHTRACVFLGVLPKWDGVKVMDLQTKKIVKKRDALFDETELKLQSPVTPLNTTQMRQNDPPWLYSDVENQTNDHRPEILDEDAHIEHNTPPPDEPIMHRPRRNRQEPEGYGNLRVHSAIVRNSPTYKIAINSSESEAWRNVMKQEIDGFIK